MPEERLSRPGITITLSVNFGLAGCPLLDFRVASCLAYGIVRTGAIMNNPNLPG